MANDSYFQFHYDNKRNYSIWRTLMAGYANENSTGFKNSNTWRSTFISVLNWINCRCTTHSWNYQICVLVVFNWYVLNGYWCFWILFINWKHECHVSWCFEFSLCMKVAYAHSTTQRNNLSCDIFLDGLSGRDEEKRSSVILSFSSGGRLNKKDDLTRYGDSHVKDKTS